MLKQKILVIDDEPVYADLAEKSLDRELYKINKAYTGADGFKKIKETKPDLILLDWNLPDIEGIEICKILKEKEETRDIPVIMFTSMSAVSQKVKGLTTGADDYITKPFEPEELSARVNAILRRETRVEELLKSQMAEVRKYIPAELVSKMQNKSKAISKPVEQTITILFADLCNFTGLTAAMKPEEVKILLNDYFKLLAEVIYKYEGSIDKFIGDAVMALFGVPIVHKDEPQRAINAAIEIRDNVMQLDVKKYGLLQLKIGINTGSVIVGAVGSDLRADYTAVGNTVNYAAKLQDIAQPGQILVSEGTFQYVKNNFKFQKVNLTEKTDKLPMAVYELLEE